MTGYIKPMIDHSWVFKGWYHGTRYMTLNPEKALEDAVNMYWHNRHYIMQHNN